MNDLENVISGDTLTSTSVNNQLLVVASANEEISRCQKEYLQSIVEVAYYSEKIKRKNDSGTKIAAWAISIGVALLLLLINIWLPFIFLFFAVIVFNSGGLSSEKETIAYQNRKDFFKKYSNVLSADQKIKWKDDSYSSESSFEGWICQECSCKNSDAASFCTSCGKEKPTIISRDRL